MPLLTRIPGLPLSAFVDCLWHHDGPPAAHRRERVLPTGALELVISLRDDPLRVYDRHNPARFQDIGNTVIAGPHEEYFVIDPAHQAALVGIHFKPGGAFPFFSLPVGELRSAHVALDAIWGARAAELRERLLEAGTPAARFAVLEQFLWARAVHAPLRHQAVAFALGAFETAAPPQSVGAMASRVGLSRRRFIEVFRDQVGLTPKRYGRVRRFQEVLRWLGQDRPIRWADVALRCGYFDQAHFIHDFRAFSGLNPTAYVALRGRHPNHVPVPG